MNSVAVFLRATVVFASSILLAALLWPNTSFDVDYVGTSIDSKSLSERAVKRGPELDRTIFADGPFSMHNMGTEFEVLIDGQESPYVSFFFEKPLTEFEDVQVTINGQVAEKVIWRGRKDNQLTIRLAEPGRFGWLKVDFKLPNAANKFSLERIEITNAIGYNLGLPKYLLKTGPLSENRGILSFVGHFLLLLIVFIFIAFVDYFVPWRSHRETREWSATLSSFTLLLLIATFAFVARNFDLYVHLSLVSLCLLAICLTAALSGFKILHFGFTPWLENLVKRVGRFLQDHSSFSPWISIGSAGILIVVWSLNSANLMFMDQWAQASDLIKFHEGNLKISDLLSVHGEFNKQTTARLIWLVSGTLFNGDVRVSMLLTLVVLIVGAIILFRVWLKIFDSRVDRATVYFSFVPVALLIFNLYQWEVLFRSDEVVRSLGNFLFICVAVGVTVFPVHILAVLGLAIALSFCQISGLLVWPLLISHAVLTKEPRKAIAFSTVAISILALYLITTDFSAANQTIASSVRSFEPLKLILFFFSVLGSPFYFFHHQLLAIFVVYFLLQFRHGSPIQSFNSPLIRFFVLLALFAIGKAIMITIGRSHYGGETASRYAHEMQYFWISVWGLVCHRINQNGFYRFGNGGHGQRFAKQSLFAFIFLSGYIVNAVIGVYELSARRDLLKIGSRHISFSDFSEHLEPITAHHVEMPSKLRKIGISSVNAIDPDWQEILESSSQSELAPSGNQIVGLVTEAKWLHSKFESQPWAKVIFVSGFALIGKNEDVNRVKVRLYSQGKLFGSVSMGSPCRYRPLAKFVEFRGSKCWHWFAYIPRSDNELDIEARLTSESGQRGLLLGLKHLANRDGLGVSTSVNVGEIAEPWESLVRMVPHSVF